ncbi:ABC transporter permease [Frankia sp. AgKG'84/4]|uniref:ABC transporter permease n=1 Tax=Frankia sp. AgKG'84/4 TaxID=573490 RepID=UPI002010A288|nr:ABC transporter permease [Frankia sp. AgKG'84/4]MCL9792918.1 ABC transporter permease [Frankia sp. AgKG'84/4]
MHVCEQAPATGECGPAPGPEPARRRAVLRQLLRRLLSGAAVLLGAVTLTFTALQLAPGDPVAVLLGPGTSASPQVRAEIRAEYGLDDPAPLRYAHYLGRLARGDLGTSYQLQQPVSQLIGDQLRPTAELAAAALALTVLIGVVIAVATAGRRPGLRAAALAWESLALSVPTFWLGIVLVSVFSFQLRILPGAGDQGAASLVLPSLTLATPGAGALSRALREGLEAALAQPFATAARARGLSPTGVTMRHALRHAAASALNLGGWLVGTLLAGTVLIETVFARPGLGSLTVQAVTDRDMPVVMGIVLTSALVATVVFTIVDLMQRVLDPRLRVEAVDR